MSTTVDAKHLRQRAFSQLRERLLRLAGYATPGPSYPFDHNTEIHQEFKRIVCALEEIAARKVDGYGPFRYDEMEKDWRWEIQSLYQDIERKFGRLKTMVRPSPIPMCEIDQVLEILSDLAVYSARGIQILIRLEAMQQEKTP
jgi:hypothetical protein